MSNETYRVGIDTGGTNTDLVVINSSNKIDTHKVPSTPEDLSVGIMNSLKEAAEGYDLSLDDFLKATDRIIHGTTVSTNAIIEGDEATTGLITTEGFRDVIELQMQRDKNVFDLRSDIKDPKQSFMDRYLRRTISERIDRQGQPEIIPDEDDVRNQVEKLKREGAESVAVVLMNSYLNDEHERSVANVVREYDLDVSTSVDIYPRIGLQDRVAVAVIDAGLKPILSEYIMNILDKLKSAGFNGSFLMMKGSGGISKPNVVRNMPIESLRSGPAAAGIGNAAIASQTGIGSVISMDMGGTSTDICLVTEGETEITTDQKIGTTRIPIPMVDIDAIGAGGGSIAWLDERDFIQIGPKSAGADPGPVCYGLGNTKPTVTDADLLQGFLNPTFFLGGDRELDKEKAHVTVEETIAEPLGLTVEEACKGIYDITNEKMASSIRQCTVEKGINPRDFTLVAVGGAGPVHACGVAETLGIDVFVPNAAGTISAFGLHRADIKHEMFRSVQPRPLSESLLSEIDAIIDEMLTEARSTLADEGTDESSWNFQRILGTRYRNQHHRVGIEVPPSASISTIEDLHHSIHEELYTFRDEESAVEVVDVRLTATAETEKPTVRTDPEGVTADSAIKDYREVLFDGNYVKTPIYDGTAKIRDSFTGPGIVEFNNTTLVVPSSFNANVDDRGNYRLTLE